MSGEPRSERCFAGRTAEIAALRASLSAAAAGRGQLVTISGEPGIGKTRTLEEFLARAGVPEASVLWGRCPEASGAPAYWPWTQALRAPVERCRPGELNELLGSEAAALARLLPEIRRRLPDVPEVATADPEEWRFQLFDAVARVLRRLAEQQTHVVVLDDVHWADEGTLRLLEFVIPEMRRSRLLIACTYRDAEMRREPDRLARLGRADERLVLRGLALDDVSIVAEDLAADKLSPGLVARLHHTSGGNPYFLGELVRWLRNENRLDAEDVGGLPDEVRHVLRQRLAPLADDERRLLTVAAALGERFEATWLAAVRGVPTMRAIEELGTAQSAGFVRGVPGRPGEFEFVHALVRETLYEEMAPRARAELHRDVARALEALHADAPERAPVAALARHYLEAAPLGEVRPAIDYAMKAGESALLRAGYEAALGHYERALDMRRLAALEPAVELRLRLAAGDAACRAFALERAREEFAEAARLARDLGDAAALALAAIGAAEAQPLTGTADQGLARLLEEALEALGHDDAPVRARLLGHLAKAIYPIREAQARRQALSEQAVAMARRLGDPAALVSAINVRCLMLSGAGSAEERLALGSEAVRIAAQRGDRRAALDAGAVVARALLEVGDISGVDREIARLEAIADEVRMPLYLWLASVRKATRALLAGRFAEAARLATEALTLVTEGTVSFRGRSHTLLMMLLNDDRDRLGESVEPLTLLVERTPNVAMFRCYLAALLLDLGQRGEARAIFEPLARREFADSPNDGVGYPSSLASLARVAVGLGDAPRARLLYDRLAPFAERSIVLPIGVGCLGAGGRYLGMLAALLGLTTEAESHFEHALALEARMGARPLQAWSQYEYARFLRGRGRPQDLAFAERLCAEAKESAAALGMLRLARLITADDRRTATGPLFFEDPAGVATLRLEGDAWTVTFGGASFSLKDTKGVHHLVTLLRRPGEELHALAVATEAGEASPVAAEEARGAALRIGDLGDAGELIDAEARAAYRERLEDLREELAEAERFNDRGRAERAEHEIELLTRELSRAFGLGGRARRAGSASERARLNVSRAIAAVLRKIAVAHPALGEHLAATVTTGTYCSYSPDPRRPVRWDL